MTKKKRTTVRFNDLIESKVDVLMQWRSFTNFTAYLEQLIREDWDVRATPEMEAQLAKLLKNVPAQRTEAVPSGSRKRNPATGAPISQAIVEAVAQLHGLPAEGERKPASAKRSSPSPKRKQGGQRRSSKKGVPKDQGRPTAGSQ